MVKNDKIVTINGQKYDKNTGLPVAKSATQPKPIHSVASRTRVTPSSAKTPKNAAAAVPATRKNGRSMDVARSKSVSRFAPKAAVTPKAKPTNKQMDIGPIKHPIAAKVDSARRMQKAQKTKAAEKPAKVIKEEAIAKALAKTTDQPDKKKGFFKRRHKFVNIFTISIVLLIVAGYLTYLNMPNLSVRIASAQAGINATYPDYHPDGYRLDGPVTYSNNQVSIKFHANTGNRAFAIKQSKSSWDSSAVKNQIEKDASSSGGTSEIQERGLTIFSYDNNTKAAWVNGGILYSISGNAPLSSEQIRHLAISLIGK